MASSNPFRKRTEAAPSVTAFNYPDSLSVETRFPALQGIESAPTPPPRTTFTKTDSQPLDSKSKTTKKVRVLSPPPLSPDSPEWPNGPSSISASTWDKRRADDALDGYSSDDSDQDTESTPVMTSAHDNARVPGNPFSKTLQDVESAEGEIKLEQERKEEGDALKAANTTRRSLDVNSFRRLLMTGNTGSGDSSSTKKNRQSMPPPTRADDSSSISLTSTDNSSREAVAYGKEPVDSSMDSQEVPDTPENELEHNQFSDLNTSAQANKNKKPPPPPSSRHGKSIKLELTGSQAPPEVLASMSASDINKPLPPAPVRKSFDDEAESPFDQEAAGKVPEFAADSSSADTPINRKAVPAPPPRRGHNRGESRAYSGHIPSVAHISSKNADHDLSRSSSLRSHNGHSRHESLTPAPPPPRRSYHNSRQSTQIPPTVAASIGAESSVPLQPPAFLSDVDRMMSATPPRYSAPVEPPSSRGSLPNSGQAGGSKTSAPPPPPARNTSVRRPASIRSIESTSRRVSYEAKPLNPMAPPPPPTRRQRGNSRGSIDGSFRRTSMDSAGRGEASPLTEEEMEYDDERNAKPSSTSPHVEGKGVNILADLDALQREVDALRGKMK